MRLSEIPTKAPELFPDTSWSVTEPDDRDPYQLTIIRATLSIEAQLAIDPMVIASAWSTEGLVDHVVGRVGKAIERKIDERSKAAKEWRETAMRYRESLRDGPWPRAGMPL